MSIYTNLELTRGEIDSLISNPWALAQIVAYHEERILEVESSVEDIHKNSIIDFHQHRIEFIKEKIKLLMPDFGIESFKELGL